MNYILQVDFTFEGPFGDELAQVSQELALSITREPGFISKIWTENPERQEAGGIYTFATYADANDYAKKHSERLINMGATQLNIKLFAINETLTAITT